MKKHLNGSSAHCPYRIAKSLNHDFYALSIIAPELNDELENRYYKYRGKNHEWASKDYYLSIDKKNNRLLMEVLKTLQYMKRSRVVMSEENIRFLLGGKMEGVKDLHFWMILRIAIYELGYM